MQVIPVEPGVPYQEFTFSIDDVEYIFDMKWNFRREIWSAGVYDADKVLLYSIQSLTLFTYPGMLNMHNPEFPFGSFAVINTSNDYTEATLDSLGESHLFVYFTASEIIEL